MRTHFFDPLNIAKVDRNRKAIVKRPRRESNPHLRFRKPLFYPLNYGDTSASKKLEGRSGKSRDQIFDFRFQFGKFPHEACLEIRRQNSLFKGSSKSLFLAND